MFSNVCVSDGVLTQFPGWAAGLDILIILRYGPEMSSANHKNISLDRNFEDIQQDLSCEGNKESICFVTFPCPYWTSAPIKAKLNLIKLVLADLLRSARGSKLSSGEVLTYSDTILSSRKVQSNPRRSNEMHLCSKNGLHRI